MKVSIWMLGCKYSTKGWRLEIIDHDTGSYHLNLYSAKDDAICLKELELDDPELHDEVQIGEAHLKTLKEELTDATARAQSEIKDYEAKFLALTNQGE